MLHLVIHVREDTEAATRVSTVHEHQEDLEDQFLVFVATGHLDHEEEDAEVMEADTICDLLLC